MYESGAVFTEAYQDHAFTETAPGHASALSGRFPIHTGITTNVQGVNTSMASILGGRPADVGASPFRFRGTTLLDWMRAAHPDTRFLSVSRKDRGAILPVGTAKGNVYWFASTGQFTTSTYYADILPTWVRRFNDRRLPLSWAGQAWTPMYGAGMSAEPDSVPAENEGRDFVFPHVMPRDAAAADTAIIQFPWMDDITLQFALEGVNRLALGAAPGRTDLLAVSLSTTDAVGHRFGPDSKEMHDQLVQLNRFLMTHARLAVAERADTLVSSADNVLSLQTAALAAHGLCADSIAKAFAREVMLVQGVARADLVSRIATADTVNDAIARRWLHVFSPASDTTRLVVTFTAHSYAASNVIATHGSPYDGDARVPLVFRGPAVRGGRVPGFARTVDLAPALAELLGVKPAEPLDGRSLLPAIRWLLIESQLVSGP